ncbi:hypothetical protein RJE46_25065 (plasmid) [Cedecea neteri]|uniref:hypothetical protein n=1 Tax=Cedecea neteri TaxID=158822 RepID=UPI00289366DB|nr:hypothetical protein [Cedecea neteri]WNJ82211.1 hypothetical protein RJE46_25065 [Cedecea neteri]
MAFGTLSGPEAIGKNWVPLGGIKPLNVTLSNCAGTQTGGAPKLTMTAAAGSVVLADSENKLFRDSSSTSRGLGIGIYRVSSPDTSSSKDFFANGTSVQIGAPGVGWSSLNQVYGYAAGVSCGSTCAAANLGSGTLKASVIFTFSYD